MSCFPSERSSIPLAVILSLFEKNSVKFKRAVGRESELFSLFHIPLSQFDSPERKMLRYAYAQRSAISIRGTLVATSFVDGRIEIVDAYTGECVWNLERAFSSESSALPPLVWLEFVVDDSQVLGEDGDGRVWLLSKKGVLDVTASLPSPGPQAIAAISPSGCCAIRTSCQPEGPHWERQMTILNVSRGRISLQSLAVPPTSTGLERRVVVPRSLGFSPDGAYVGAFDDTTAHIWSATTTEYVEVHMITAKHFWILNRWSNRDIDVENSFNPYPIFKTNSLHFHPTPRPVAMIPPLDPTKTSLLQTDKGTNSASSGTASSLFLAGHPRQEDFSELEFPPLPRMFIHPHKRPQINHHPCIILVGGGQNIRLAREDERGSAYTSTIPLEIFLPPIFYFDGQRSRAVDATKEDWFNEGAEGDEYNEGAEEDGYNDEAEENGYNDEHNEEAEEDGYNDEAEEDGHNYGAQDDKRNYGAQEDEHRYEAEEDEYTDASRCACRKYLTYGQNNLESSVHVEVMVHPGDFRA